MSTFTWPPTGWTPGTPYVDTTDPNDTNPMSQVKAATINALIEQSGRTAIYFGTGDSWTELVAELALNEHAMVHFTDDVTIPAKSGGGAWDLNDATFHGNHLNNPYVPMFDGRIITIADGCKFTNWNAHFLNDGLLLYSVSTDYVIEYTTSHRVLHLEYDAQIACKTHPAVKVTRMISGDPDFTYSLISIRDGSAVVLPSDIGIEDGDSPSIEIVGDGTFFVVFNYAYGKLAAGTLKSSGDGADSTVDFKVFSPDADFSTTHGAYAGTIVTTLYATDNYVKGASGRTIVTGATVRAQLDAIETELISVRSRLDALEP